MTVRLRPHHLLCLLTYVGKGYSPAFTANYDLIAGRIGQGEDILIVVGPDDICAPLLHDGEAHCRRDSVTERDRLAAVSLIDLVPGSTQPGARFTLNSSAIERMRGAFAAGHTRVACLGCEWSAFCTSIAVEGFEGVRIS